MYYDWLVIFALLTIVVTVAVFTKRYTLSVSDFLSANRCGGRYMLSVASGVAEIGVINLISVCELYYKSGFNTTWWMTLLCLVSIVISLTGWIAYRFRETRAMTMAQFFEMRYSRNFRIFSGITCWLSGILNYGIFPIVTARLIVYFMGMPASVSVAGFVVPMQAVVMFFLLSIAVYLTTSGGQITVMVTDFLQASFANVVFFVLAIFMIVKFSWPDILDGLKLAPVNQSMINPFKMEGESDFNFLFFSAWTFLSFYGFMTWQGSQGYNCAAKNPHEARMARVVSSWKMLLLWTMMLVFSIVAFAVMHNPKYAAIAGSVQTSISKISDVQIQEQLKVFIVLKHILPTGLIGLFCAVLIAIALGSDNSNLHSWGSILVQDVIMPFCKKPLSAGRHLFFLRFSIICVAIFAFCFGLIFPLKDYLLVFMTITGSVYVGGAGVAIIGGLYWKRGTVAGAWGGMITGMFLAITGIALQNIIWPFVLPGLKGSYPSCSWLQHLPAKFPINGMVLTALFALTAVSVYVVISLLSKNPHFNMDRMLHRGEYAIKGEHIDVQAEPVKGWRVLFNWGGKEFTKGDRLIYAVTFWFNMLGVIAFIVGTIWFVTIGISDKAWSLFWYYKTAVAIIAGCIAVIWLLFGGFKDLFEMFRTLKTAKRDEHDDGRVVLDNDKAEF